MLARFSLHAARRLIDAQIEQAGCSTQHDNEENSLVVDLNALHSLLPENPWHRVASVCGQALPLCASIQKALSSDFDHVTNLLLDLELRHAVPENLSDVLPVEFLNEEPPIILKYATDSDHTYFHARERPPKKRRKGPHSASRFAFIQCSTTLNHRKKIVFPLVIPSPHPSAPSIVITLSPPQPQETSCLVPCQDYAFGHSLTVPCHPVFNKIHPPMVRDSRAPPHRNGWKWQDGHWTAVLPTLTEQAKRGIFSRPVPSRKKAHRYPNRHIHMRYMKIVGELDIERYNMAVDQRRH